MSDYVYFVRPIGMRGPIKIGYSNYPQRRLGELFVWSPFPLEIVVTIPGTRKLELNIQECLVQSRSHKEWFHATDETLGLIEKLLDGIPIEEAIDLSARRGRMAAKRGRMAAKRRRSEQTKGPKTMRVFADEARNGATIEQAAKAAGIKVSTAVDYARKHRIAFSCGPSLVEARSRYLASRPLTSRQMKMNELHRSGKTLSDIGKEFGLTHERVRQLLIPFQSFEIPSPQAPRAGDKEAGLIR